MGYCGTKPGWTPDRALAAREENPVSVAEQVEEEKIRWAADPENPANQADEVEETAPADDDEPEAHRYL